MGPSNILFTIVLLASLSFFGFSARRLLSYLQIGKPEDRFDQPLRRLQRVMNVALLQTKLLREPLAGLMHGAIFWGFLALIAAVVESIGEGITGHFSFRFLGRIYSLVTFTQEIFCVLVVVSVALALWRRFISRVKRLQAGARGNADAAVILVWILLIVSTLLFQNAARISIGEDGSGLRYPSIVSDGGDLFRQRFYRWMESGVLVDAYRSCPRLPELSSILKASSRIDVDPERVFL